MDEHWRLRRLLATALRECVVTLLHDRLVRKQLRAARPHHQSALDRCYAVTTAVLCAAQMRRHECIPALHILVRRGHFQSIDVRRDLMLTRIKGVLFDGNSATVLIDWAFVAQAKSDL